jgi:hypothetical protein
MALQHTRTRKLLEKGHTQTTLVIWGHNTPTPQRTLRPGQQQEHMTHPGDAEASLHMRAVTRAVSA